MFKRFLAELTWLRRNPTPFVVVFLCVFHYGGCAEQTYGDQPAVYVNDKDKDKDKKKEKIDWDLVFKCLHQKEASGRLNPPDGDNGKSIGPYQIGRTYWEEALKQDPSIGGKYEDCRDKAYSEKVIPAYMDRWLTLERIKRSMRYEDICRTHNGGGPRAMPTHYAHKRWLEKTQEYWDDPAFDPLRAKKPKK